MKNIYKVSKTRLFSDTKYDFKLKISHTINPKHRLHLKTDR